MLTPQFDIKRNKIFYISVNFSHFIHLGSFKVLMLMNVLSCFRTQLEFIHHFLYNNP